MSLGQELRCESAPKWDVALLLGRRIAPELAVLPFEMRNSSSWFSQLCRNKCEIWARCRPAARGPFNGSTRTIPHHRRPDIAATCAHDILNLTATDQPDSHSKQHFLDLTAVPTPLICLGISVSFQAAA
jgi:hypothetical protein